MVVGWQRKGFRVFWAGFRGNRSASRPEVSVEVRVLIKQMAELGPVAEGRIRSPIPSLNDHGWWEHEFKVRSEGLSLSNPLVIVLQLPEKFGWLHA
jgi:hypothetical protein